MTLPRIHIGRPQRLAGLLLLAFFAQCLWVIGHQELSTADYRFSTCGRQIWERPSPLAGYFTTCGNLNGDGTFAYRVAGLPLTLERLALGRGPRRGRPPAWMSDEGAPRRRGRPPGSKNKPAEPPEPPEPPRNSAVA